MQRKEVSGNRNNMRSRKTRRSPALIIFILICVCTWLIGAYIITNGNNEASLDIPPIPNINTRQGTSQTDSQTLTYEQLALISNDHFPLIPDTIKNKLR